MSQPFCRERRSWTVKEDQLLREAVQKEDPDNANPSKWHAIAKHVPNRTNKDCRKRWFAKMASDVVKGGWSPEEDERLVKGIERYGTRWSLVASVVQTRNSDQCAKRWTDTLNPAIDRTQWSPEADEMLLRAVNEHGKVWTKIVKTYFPGRTGLSAKNRYNSITRFSSDPSRARPRRKSEGGHYLPSRKAESISSSSSCGSPSSPSISLPYLSQSPFPAPIDTRSTPYLTTFPDWDSPSSSVTPEEGSLRSSPMDFDFIQGNNNPNVYHAPPSSDVSYQPIDMNSQPTYPEFTFFPDGTNGPSPATPNPLFKALNPSQLHDPSQSYPHYSQLGSNGANNGFAIYDVTPSLDASPMLDMGGWENNHNNNNNNMLVMNEAKNYTYKMPVQNTYALRS